MCIKAIFILTGPVLLLAGCTTAASGIAVAPPGINKYSFRECLLAQGFYSQPALSGIALRDWHYRHTWPRPLRRLLRHDTSQPTRYQLLEQSDTTFVADAAEIIANGLMPAEEFWDPRIADQQPSQDRKQGPSSLEPHFEDNGLNAPYVWLSAPGQYDFSHTVTGEAFDAHLPRKLHEPSPGDHRAPDWRLNRFLDCYIAPVGTTLVKPAATGEDLAPYAAFGNGDDDLEGRLLRGHILLALLSRYGTELIISHPGNKQVAQAELLLGHIKEAETALRSASIVMDPEARVRAAALTATDQDDKPILFDEGKPYEKKGAGVAHNTDGIGIVATINNLTLVRSNDEALSPQLGWQTFVTRLLRVFQVGVDVERIDAEQSLDRGGNLIAAFSKGSGFLGVLKDGLKGVVTVQKVRIYGDAYLRDARATLAAVRSSTKFNVVLIPKPKPEGVRSWTYSFDRITRSWSRWDSEITQSCLVLATIAKKDSADANCVSRPDGGTKQ